jgi:hypothetical protein
MFNINKKGKPICKVVGGDDDGEIIYLDSLAKEDKGKIKKNTFEKLEIKDGVFQQVPDTTTERECGMITGMSGSGKSYYTNNYIKQYKLAYKKNPVYFFSVLGDDKSIDAKLVTRVRIDEGLITEPLSINDVKNSLCVFDDIEMIKDKKIKDALFDFINEILTTGRHTNTSCILTIHYPNSKYIRTLLNECHWFVYFPFGSNRATNYVLENYIGIGSKDIKYIKSLKSRWATIFKNYPQCVLTEHNLFSIADIDN